MNKLFLFLLLMGSLYASSIDSEQATEFRLNQLEKELQTIKAENQKLSGYIAEAGTLTHSKKENFSEEQIGIHSSIVSKIFFFIVVFSGFWIFFVGIAGWMYYNKRTLCLVENYYS